MHVECMHEILWGHVVPLMFILVRSCFFFKPANIKTWESAASGFFCGLRITINKDFKIYSKRLSYYLSKTLKKVYFLPAKHIPCASFWVSASKATVLLVSKFPGLENVRSSDFPLILIPYIQSVLCWFPEVYVFTSPSVFFSLIGSLKNFPSLCWSFHWVNAFFSWVQLASLGLLFWTLYLANFLSLHLVLLGIVVFFCLEGTPFSLHFASLLLHIRYISYIT